MNHSKGLSETVVVSDQNRFCLGHITNQNRDREIKVCQGFAMFRTGSWPLGAHLGGCPFALHFELVLVLLDMSNFGMTTVEPGNRFENSAAERSCHLTREAC